jgi:hypothetical protein
MFVMAKLGNLQARILIDAGTTSGPVEVGSFEIPITIRTETREGNRLGVKVELPEDAIRAALKQWAVDMAEGLA